MSSVVGGRLVACVAGAEVPRKCSCARIAFRFRYAASAQAAPTSEIARCIKNLRIVTTFSLEIIPSIILVAVRDVLMLAARRVKEWQRRRRCFLTHRKADVT